MIPDLQKFWTGAPVAAPQREAVYFRANGLEAQTVTRGDDSRTAAPIANLARLALEAPDGYAAVQFAVIAQGAWPKDARFRATVADRTTTHTHLRPDAWLDVRIDRPAAASHLEIAADAPVFVSYPRLVRTTEARDSGIRHIVVIVLDGVTTRVASDTHPTMPGVALTPNSDRFFAGGFDAPNGYSSGEWTMPASASFFTGLHTARHGMFQPYARVHLPASRPLLAERFQAAGFHTLCLSVANRLSPAYGHHRGFDRFIYHFPEPGFTKNAYDTAVWLDEVTGHLASHRYDRTFSYVHLPDVHPPWDIPRLTRAFNLARRGSSTGHDLRALREHPDAAEQGRQLYLLRLHDVDRALGGLYDFIDRTIAGETLVVLTSDHGTPWHSLRVRRPKNEPYLVDDRTAIAFRMRGPGVTSGTHDGLTSPTLDLMPTLLARAGLEIPHDIDGRDLLDPAYSRDHVITESLYGGIYEIAVRDGQRTYIERYPLDEARVAVSGPPRDRGLYPANADDYCTPLGDDPGRLAEIAHSHIDRYLRKDSAA